MKRRLIGNCVKGKAKQIAVSASFLALLVVFISDVHGEGANYGSSENWGEKYLKAGTIHINDPKLITFGTVDGDKAILHFNLMDVGKFTGHLCAGATTGFMVTKLALESLYSHGEIPQRGDIKMTTSAKGEPMEVAAYIMAVSDEEHHGFVSWVVDKSLSEKQGLFVFVFERLSTGKKVKIKWNKPRTLKSQVEDVKKFKQKKMRTVHGLATDAEAKEWGRTVNSIVMNIINNPMDHYEVEVIDQGAKTPSMDYKKGCQSCHHFKG
jgi:hypothetical protein